MPNGIQVPKDEQECCERMDVLRSDMRSIEIQLGDRNRLDPETRKRMVSKKYWDWRQKAKFALTCKQEEFMLLKNWLKERKDRDIEKTLADALWALLLTGSLSEPEVTHCLAVSTYFRKIHELGMT